MGGRVAGGARMHDDHRIGNVTAHIRASVAHYGNFVSREVPPCTAVL